MSSQGRLFAALLIAVLLGGLCWAVYAWGHSEGFSECEKAHSEAQAEARAQAKKERAKKQAEISQVVDRREDQRQEDKARVVRIVKEVPKYVYVEQKNDSVCNLSRGTVCLLNQSLQNRDACDRSLTAAEARAPSTITEQAVIEAAHGWLAEYHDLRRDHNALVDAWLIVERDARE